MYASTCCADQCSTLEPCKTGYFCGTKNGTDSGICDYCGSYNNTSLGSASCKSLPGNHNNNTELCEEQCKPLECNASQAPLRLELTTDAYPRETWWDIMNQSTGTHYYAQGGPYQNSNTSVVEEVCVPKDTCSVFRISDGFGDGMCCDGDINGTYTLFFNGTEIASGGNFGFSESTSFGSNCTVAPAPSL
mmetsp:Transcript_15318/g.21341  ORF Transcript_15318/g.21341 Transcript_15318/m.21341 type:complete len:190 (+) Transcript_15318:326-895(+)